MSLQLLSILLARDYKTLTKIAVSAGKLPLYDDTKLF